MVSNLTLLFSKENWREKRKCKWSDMKENRKTFFFSFIKVEAEWSFLIHPPMFEVSPMSNTDPMSQDPLTRRFWSGSDPLPFQLAALAKHGPLLVCLLCQCWQLLPLKLDNSCLIFHFCVHRALFMIMYGMNKFHNQELYKADFLIHTVAWEI